MDSTLNLNSKSRNPQLQIRFLLKVFQFDHENHDNLETIKIHLADFFNRIDASFVDLTSILRGKHHFQLKANELVTKGGYKTGKKSLHGDEPCLDLWEGTIYFDSSKTDFRDVLNYLTGPVVHLNKESNSFIDRIGFLWKLVEENDERYEKMSNFDMVLLEPSQPLYPMGFGFGNLINGTLFVEQFRTPEHNYDRNWINPVEKLTLNHSYEEMTLIARLPRKFKFVFGYKSIRSVTISRSRTGFKLFFQMSNPPKIFIETNDLDPDVIDMRKSKFYAFDYFSYRANPSKKPRFPKETWARWSDFDNIKCVGKCSVFAVHLDQVSQIATELVRLFYVWRRYSPLKIFFGLVHMTKGIAHTPDFLPDVPYDVNYALQGIESVSFAFQDDLKVNRQLDELFSFIREEIDKGNTEWLITSLNKLCNDYLYGNVYHALSRLKAIFKRTKNKWPTLYKVKSNPYIKHLRRVLLTPTRVLILPELTYQTSKFLEIAEEDCVIRLSIRDEDMTNLGFAVTRNEDDLKRVLNRNKSPDMAARLPSPEEYFLQKCFADRLLPSLEIAGKSFQIFGASSSQIREHGMIIYATDSQGRNAVKLRDQMGKIHVKGISKYISRIGLSLSQVLAFVDLPEYTEIRYTKDILAGSHPETHNPYNFTDGCGLMSMDLAKYIWSDLKRQNVIKLDPHKRESMSTAYQVRFMGCKGMIVIDETLKGNVIVLRESMRKIDTKPDSIGIVKISEPRRAYLNRPLVTILNQIGLSNEFFVRLLSDATSDLINSFRVNIKASKALLMFSDLHRFIDHLKLANLGYDLLVDPFFRSALELVFHQGLELIKQKARIPLNMDTSRTLFGVADPTATNQLPYVLVPNCDAQQTDIFDNFGTKIKSFPGMNKQSLFFDEKVEKCLANSTNAFVAQSAGLLKYGQVFVFPSDFTKPLDCDVIVTKFPCMHPGDVRRLKAVDIPELHSIRDCIVFPVNGPRPHANEMAGSDLDGDEYCVIWSSDFMNIKIDDPMVFPDSTDDTSAPINNHEIVMFYMRYLQDCSVGRIAATHLVWADLLDRGIFSDRCVCLARKYSIALDSPKTGISTTLSKKEVYEEPPDFTQNWHRKPSYHSSRALGSIYRTISMFELFLAEETQKFKVLEFKPDHRLEHPNWKSFEAEAIKQHSMYSAIISYLIEISEFANEVELFNQISEKSSLFAPIDQLNARPNQQDSMIYCITNLLVKPMEDNFYAEFNTESWKCKSESELRNGYMAKASAYYKVTMDRIKKSKNPICGLPWIGKYSNHLFDLLQNAHVNDRSPDRLIYKQNKATVLGGFSGDLSARRNSAKQCWNVLGRWIEYYLLIMGADEIELQQVIDHLRDLFDKVVDYYITNARKKESPGQILSDIFVEIKTKQTVLDFKRNLFDNCNDPIGLMTVLILESKYYEGTMTTRLPDGSFICMANSSYHVLKKEETTEDQIRTFIQMIGDISRCVSIVYTPPLENRSSFKLSIFGSRASILICQSLIFIHNRLTSDLPHFVKNPTRSLNL